MQRLRRDNNKRQLCDCDQHLFHSHTFAWITYGDYKDSNDELLSISGAWLTAEHGRDIACYGAEEGYDEHVRFGVCGL